MATPSATQLLANNVGSPKLLTTSDNIVYVVHTFTSGTTSFEPTQRIPVEYLVVANGQNGFDGNGGWKECNGYGSGGTGGKSGAKYGIALISNSPQTVSVGASSVVGTISVSSDNTNTNISSAISGTIQIYAKSGNRGLDGGSCSGIALYWKNGGQGGGGTVPTDYNGTDGASGNNGINVGDGGGGGGGGGASGYDTRGMFWNPGKGGKGGLGKTGIVIVRYMAGPLSTKLSDFYQLIVTILNKYAAISATPSYKNDFAYDRIFDGNTKTINDYINDIKTYVKFNESNLQDTTNFWANKPLFDIRNSDTDLQTLIDRFTPVVGYIDTVIGFKSEALARISGFYNGIYVPNRRFLLDSDLTEFQSQITDSTKYLTFGPPITEKAAFSDGFSKGTETFMGIRDRMNGAFRQMISKLLIRLNSTYMNLKGGITVSAELDSYASATPGSNQGWDADNQKALNTSTDLVNDVIPIGTKIGFPSGYWITLVPQMQSFLQPRMTLLNGLYTWASTPSNSNITSNILGNTSNLAHSATTGLGIAPIAPLVFTQPVVTGTGINRTFYGIHINNGVTSNSSKPAVLGFAANWSTPSGVGSGFSNIPSGSIPALGTTGIFSNGYNIGSLTPGTEVSVSARISNPLSNTTNFIFGNTFKFTL